jgi:hypothetical protein
LPPRRSRRHAAALAPSRCRTASFRRRVFPPLFISPLHLMPLFFSADAITLLSALMPPRCPPPRHADAFSPP